jgi:hypothetical protein
MHDSKIEGGETGSQAVPGLGVGVARRRLALDGLRLGRRVGLP